MSKYSRIRKAICRISHLSTWYIDRTYFKKVKPKTWKESYRKYKKEHIKYYGYNKEHLKKYKDVISDYNIRIWDLPGINNY